MNRLKISVTVTAASVYYINHNVLSVAAAAGHYTNGEFLPSHRLDKVNIIHQPYPNQAGYPMGYPWGPGIQHGPAKDVNMIKTAANLLTTTLTNKSGPHTLGEENQAHCIHADDVSQSMSWNIMGSGENFQKFANDHDIDLPADISLQLKSYIDGVGTLDEYPDLRNIMLDYPIRFSVAIEVKKIIYEVAKLDPNDTFLGPNFHALKIKWSSCKYDYKDNGKNPAPADRKTVQDTLDNFNPEKSGTSLWKYLADYATDDDDVEGELGTMMIVSDGEDRTSGQNYISKDGSSLPYGGVEGSKAFLARIREEKPGVEVLLILIGEQSQELKKELRDLTTKTGGDFLHIDPTNDPDMRVALYGNNNENIKTIWKQKLRELLLTHSYYRKTIELMAKAIRFNKNVPKKFQDLVEKGNIHLIKKENNPEFEEIVESVAKNEVKNINPNANPQEDGIEELKKKLYFHFKNGGSAPEIPDKEQKIKDAGKKILVIDDLQKQQILNNGTAATGALESLLNGALTPEIQKNPNYNDLWKKVAHEANEEAKQILGVQRQTYNAFVELANGTYSEGNSSHNYDQNQMKVCSDLPEVDAQNLHITTNAINSFRFEISNPIIQREMCDVIIEAYTDDKLLNDAQGSHITKKDPDWKKYNPMPFYKLQPTQRKTPVAQIVRRQKDHMKYSHGSLKRGLYSVHLEFNNDSKYIPFQTPHPCLGCESSSCDDPDIDSSRGSIRFTIGEQHNPGTNLNYILEFNKTGRCPCCQQPLLSAAAEQNCYDYHTCQPFRQCSASNPLNASIQQLPMSQPAPQQLPMVQSAPQQLPMSQPAQQAYQQAWFYGNSNLVAQPHKATVISGPQQQPPVKSPINLIGSYNMSTSQMGSGATSPRQNNTLPVQQLHEPINSTNYGMPMSSQIVYGNTTNPMLNLTPIQQIPNTTLPTTSGLSTSQIGSGNRNLIAQQTPINNGTNLSSQTQTQIGYGSPRQINSLSAQQVRLPMHGSILTSQSQPQVPTSRPYYYSPTQTPNLPVSGSHVGAASNSSFQHTYTPQLFTAPATTSQNPYGVKQVSQTMVSPQVFTAPNSQNLYDVKQVNPHSMVSPQVFTAPSSQTNLGSQVRQNVLPPQVQPAVTNFSNTNQIYNGVTAHSRPSGQYMIPPTTIQTPVPPMTSTYAPSQQLRPTAFLSSGSHQYRAMAPATVTTQNLNQSQQLMSKYSGMYSGGLRPNPVTISSPYIAMPQALNRNGIAAYRPGPSRISGRGA